MIDFLIIIIFISDGFSATTSVTTFQNRIASSHAFLPGKTLKFLMSFVDVTALNASQNDFS